MKLVAAKCPSCGANIKVDTSLKFTKCEYCDSQIVVEEAVENLLKVELKDSPTLDNYLKLGERYYNNREFGEAYNAYSKAEEIEPDNPIVVLRKGIARSMISEYNNFDVNSATNGLKNALDLMKKMKFSHDEMDDSIDEVGSCLYASYKYLLDVYRNNKLDKDQTKGYINRLEACLDGFVYLDSIEGKGKALDEKIVLTILEIINSIIDNSNGNYHLSTSYLNKLKDMKKNYLERSGNRDVKPKYNYSEKVVEVDSKKTKFYNILSYVMVFFLGILLLGSIFNSESFWVILLWLLATLSFVPYFKSLLIKKFGSNMKTVVLIIRVVLVVICLILLGTTPMVFENTFKSDNISIVLKEGKYTYKDGDTIIRGTYQWDSKDNKYYINVEDENSNKYTYEYYDNGEGGRLCLYETDKCTKIYLPVD